MYVVVAHVPLETKTYVEKKKTNWVDGGNAVNCCGGI